MSVQMAGIDHNLASLDVRSVFSFTKKLMEQAYKDFLALPAVEGCVIISTVTNLIGVCLYRVVWVRLIVPDGSVEQMLACYPISWIVISVFMAFYYLIRQKQILAAQIPRRAETGSRG